MRVGVLAAFAAAAAAAATAATAQSAPSADQLRANALVARGDTMLIAGRLFGAESAYYSAAHLAPHDPATRLALGRYLAGRGRWRIGATLMEEARHFGGNPGAVAGVLASVYAQLGMVDSTYKRANDWAALAALPSSAVSVGERQRAEYLQDNLPALEGPDSAIVLYTVSDSHLLGRVKLSLGGDSVFAVIDGRTSGLVLDTSWLRRDSVKGFAPRGTRDPAAVFGVVKRVQMGDVVFVNQPVRFQPLRGPHNALIGLDVFSALAPTFDPRVGFVMVRRSSRVTDSLPGWRIPTFVSRSGVQVVKGDTMFPIGHPDVQQYFRVGKWTWDARRGVVVVDSVGVAPGAGTTN
jgi:hypothetical protein